LRCATFLSRTWVCSLRYSDASGWTATYREAAIDDLSDPVIAEAAPLIILGGPIGAYETDIFPFLIQEIALLQARLARSRATPGILLCAQLPMMPLDHPETQTKKPPAFRALYPN
jgi:hypothetical protein